MTKQDEDVSVERFWRIYQTLDPDQKVEVLVWLRERVAARKEAKAMPPQPKTQRGPRGKKIATGA